MDTGIFKKYSGNPFKFALLGFLSVIAIFLTLYCLTNNTQIVFTHFYYIPIVIAAYWFQKKGVLYATLLSGFYLVCVYTITSPDLMTLVAAFFRVAVFLGISLVIAILSIMLSRQQEELANSEQKFRGIWEHIQAGIILVDSGTHQILAANPEAEKMIGYSEQEMIGHLCHKFICPATEGNCPVSDLGYNVDHSERVLLSRSGREIPVLKTVTATGDTARKYFIENFVDISRMKDAENALIAYIREATLRIRNPVELVRDNLGEIRDQLTDDHFSRDVISMAIAVQQKNIDGILENLRELEHAIAEKRREIPDALRDYLKR